MAERSRECSVEGCPGRVIAKGLCGMHYQRLQNKGSVGGAEPLRVARHTTNLCSYPGCERREKLRRGLCQMHYVREYRLAGSPLYIKHGYSRHPLFQRWVNMVRRCTDPTNPGYADWGGRGITLCERWQPPAEVGFANFLADMGDPPELGYSIDRIDNDGPYSPENCRWATAAQQTRNRRALPRVRVDLLLAAFAEVGVPIDKANEAIALARARARRRMM